MNPGYVDDEEYENMTEEEREQYDEFCEERAEEIREQKDFEASQACTCGALGFKDGKLALYADCCCGAL